MFENTQSSTIERNGVALHVRTTEPRGGMPLLLMHGHPQSSAMWHRVVDALALRHQLVMLDLRGYGDSARPMTNDEGASYTKRVMAADAMHVMRSLGHTQFGVLAHDRGARVAHRLAADHASAVTQLMLLDIAPTLAMYTHTTEAFARAYWHWFFLIQPGVLPQALIESDPVRYLRAVMGTRHAGLAVFADEAMAQYERCIQIPGTAAAMVADYRASAGLDLRHDEADIAQGHKLRMPLRVLWGEHGAVAQNFDVLALWRERCTQVSGLMLPCGHYIAEEAPIALTHEALVFFSQ